MDNDSISAENQNLISIYKSLFKKWVKEQMKLCEAIILDDSELQINASQSTITLDYFKKHILRQVHKYTQLQITNDNLSGQAITDILKYNSNYQIWDNKSQFFKKTKKYRQKLMKIATLLYHLNYFTLRKYRSIKKLYQKDPTLKDKVAVLLVQLQNNKVPESNLLKIWNKCIEYSFSKFWSHYIFKINNFQDQDQLIDLYTYLKQIIKIKVSSHIFGKLQFAFEGLQSISICLPTNQTLERKSIFIQKLISQINLFHPLNSNVLKIFLQKYNTVCDLLVKNLITSNVRFQTYGSFRSKFCLINSDIDVTIFSETDAQYSSTQQQMIRQFNINVLRQLQKVLYKQKKHIFWVKIQRIFKAKVPLLTISFSQDEYIKGLDFVANNRHGVQNSELLSHFSRDLQVQNFCILTKQWAKSKKLVDRFRFSSYGIILMTLYYLMRNKKIEYLTDYSLKPTSNCQFIGYINYYEQMLSFLQFYSESGPFFSYDNFVCLVYGCINNHAKIEREDFLINIHDFIDGTNPGRFKKSNSAIFFDAITHTKRQLMKIQDQQLQDVFQILRDILGF